MRSAGKNRQRALRSAAISAAASALVLLGAGPALAGPASERTATGVACAPPGSARTGNELGIVASESVLGKGAAMCGNGRGVHGAVGQATPYQGSPPLTYHGGPVMSSGSTVGAVTVTPIFWAPSGFSFPSNYETLINQFVSDAQTDSGLPTNVFATLVQYTGPGSHHLTYSITAGPPVTVSDAFPTSGGCTADSGAVYSDNSGYRACLTDAQILAEVKSVLTAKGLPSNLGNIYPVFLPKGVEACLTTSDGTASGECSINAADPSNTFCGYHASTPGTPRTAPVYATMPFPIYASPTHQTCGSDSAFPTVESPNSDPDGDVEISVLSREISGAISDPLGTAWFDSGGNEIGDDCAGIYGAPATFGGLAGTFFNQTIAGDTYFLQEEFSNEDYVADTSGCIEQEDLPTASFVVTTTHPQEGSPVLFDATASNDPDPNGGIASYSWDFGDGETGTGATPTHVYIAPGKYLVSLIVTDIDGGISAATTAKVNVTGPILNPPADLISSPGTLQALSGTIGASQSAVGGSVTLTGPSGAPEPITVVHWDSSGIVVWLPPRTPTGNNKLKLSEDDGSTTVPLLVVAASDPSQAITPLYNLTPDGQTTSLPVGVTQDQAGNLWFADGSHNSIDELTTAKKLVEYPLATADSGPTGIVLDQSGNVWVTQDLSGQVTELQVAHASPGTTDGEVAYNLAADAAPDGLSVDPYGDVWIAEGTMGVLGEIVAGTTPVLKEWDIGGDIESVLADSFGNVWAADGFDGIDHVVPSQLPAPEVSTVVTTGLYPVGGTTSPIGSGTQQLALAPNGDVWFTQSAPPKLGVIVPSSSNPADDRWAYTSYPAFGETPGGLGIDPAGNLWVADPGAQIVFEFSPGKINPARQIPGNWNNYVTGTLMTNPAEGDEGNNLYVSPNGGVEFTGYLTNVLTAGTPFGASDVQGYLGLLPHVAKSPKGEVKVTKGITGKRSETAGSGSATVVIPARTAVTVPGAGAFSGIVSPPRSVPSFAPPAPSGSFLRGSPFGVSAEQHNGVAARLAFSKAVTVTFGFKLPAGITAAQVRSSKLWAYDAGAFTWTKAGGDAGDPGGKVTVIDGRVLITLRTRHLSPFALLRPGSSTALSVQW